MKRNLKRILCAAGFVLCGFITGSCVNTIEAGQKDAFEFKKVDNDHSRLYTYIMTDNRKDVEYIVVTGGRGVAITPRLNK